MLLGKKETENRVQPSRELKAGKIYKPCAGAGLGVPGDVRPFLALLRGGIAQEVVSEQNRQQNKQEALKGHNFMGTIWSPKL